MEHNCLADIDFIVSFIILYYLKAPEFTETNYDKNLSKQIFDAKNLRQYSRQKSTYINHYFKIVFHHALVENGTDEWE